MDEQIAKMLAAFTASPLALFLAGVAAGIEIRPVVNPSEVASPQQAVK